MKPYLFAIVILTVASVGSASFAQDAQPSLRTQEEKVKAAMSTPRGRETIAVASSAGVAASVYNAGRVRSPHLTRLDTKIGELQKALEVKAPNVAEAEKKLQAALMANTTDDIVANHKIILESQAKLKSLSPEALAQVENTPGEITAYVKQQQATLDSMSASHLLTIQQKEEAIKQAKLDYEAAKVASPEVEALAIELEDATLVRAARARQAVFATFGRRVVSIGVAGTLAYVAYHEVKVLRQMDVGPRAATPEETNEFIQAVAQGLK